MPTLTNKRTASVPALLLIALILSGTQIIFHLDVAGANKQLVIFCSNTASCNCIYDAACAPCLHPILF